MSTEEEQMIDRSRVNHMLGHLDYVARRIKQFNTSESNSDTIAVDLIVEIVRDAQEMLAKLGGIEIKKEIPASDSTLGG